MGTLALIGLGSNLGDRKATLDDAVAALAAVPGIEVRRVSAYHETAPVGGPSGQGAFLNAAAAVETSLNPASLHAALRAIEARAGRVRKVRWGARTLDLDLLLFGDRIVDEPALKVPHPRMAFRRFVLAPLAEVAPDHVEPRTGRTILELLENLDRRPSYVAISAGGDSWWQHAPAVLYGRTYEDLVCADPHLILRSPIYAGLVDRHPNARTIDFHRRTGHLDEPVPPVSPARRLEVEAQDALHQLDCDCWTSVKDPETWLVTDFWFDEFYLRRRKELASDPTEFLRYRQDFLGLREQVLAPTFVVVVEPIARELDLHPDRAPEQWPIGRDTPLLIPESMGVDAMVDEILATCQASRA